MSVFLHHSKIAALIPKRFQFSLLQVTSQMWHSSPTSTVWTTQAPGESSSRPPGTSPVTAPSAPTPSEPHLTTSVSFHIHSSLSTTVFTNCEALKQTLTALEPSC